MTRVFAPGRVCLFGEHQDYLGFPVIAAAIDLGITIDYLAPRDDGKVVLDMPDVGQVREIVLDYPVPYKASRDYLVAALNIFHRDGFPLEGGFDCRITGTLPISAGASSSSAMVVAWIRLLAFLVGRELAPADLARLANQAEVTEFGEAGGWMDHVTSATGGILFIRPDFTTNPPEPLDVPPDFKLVLGNSLEKKETVENLRMLRKNVEDQLASYKEINPGFDLTSDDVLTVDFIKAHPELKTRYPFIHANIMNGIFTREALDLFREGGPDATVRIGELVSHHHSYLRDVHGVSTPKIERMIQAAMDAGAAGCKINGSGFGGTMIAVCSGSKAQAAVAGAIEDAGGQAFKVEIGAGARLLE